MNKRKVKVGGLKIDEKLTQIRPVNLVFVSRYRQAYRQGSIFPLIIIQKGTKRIVSGNHRVTALLQEYGKDHTIEVFEKEYKNELEILSDFAKENANHGNAISDFTKRKLTAALVKENATPEFIASLFNISVRRVEQLGEGMIKVVIGSGKTEEVVDKPAKHGFTPEKPIKETDYKEHERKDRGFTVIQQTSQLVRWLEKDLITHNPKNMAALTQLQGALEKFLKENKVLAEVE